MKPIAITMGDPAGIGPEICAKLFAGGLQARAMVIGDAGVLARAAAMAGASLIVREIAAPGDTQAKAGVLDVLSVTQLPADLPLGQVDARAGAAAYAYVEKAIDLALAGEVAAVVTAPISKEAMRAAGIGFAGHTDILAARAGGEVAMMLANDALRVILVTDHVSLRQAIADITAARVLTTISLAEQICRAYGIARPRVAVAGLNPHAGEGGMFGDEDGEVIAPAIAAARGQGVDASGPWPPDTVFMRARQGEFDIVVAQYHDQGLIPVKYLGLERGVNITVGLPFVRTSVDHGTAFDIAGRGIADPSSLRTALEQALRLARDGG